MFAKDQNLNLQHILHSIVRGAIPQFLCHSPIIDAIPEPLETGFNVAL